MSADVSAPSRSIDTMFNSITSIECCGEVDAVDVDAACAAVAAAADDDADDGDIDCTGVDAPLIVFCGVDFDAQLFQH